MCNSCTDAEKRDRSDLGISCPNPEWDEAEDYSGQIFDVRDLRAMNHQIKQIGIAAEKELFE